MKKILFVLILVVAVTLGTVAMVKAADTTSTASKAQKPKLDLPCTQNAVEKRDNAIIAGLDKYYSNVKTALEARRDALKTAWGIETAKERKAGVKAAWDNFKGTWKKARAELNKARIAAWKQFDTDRKACKVSEGVSETAYQGIDASL